MSLFFSVSNSNLSSRTQYKFWLIKWWLLVAKSCQILCDPMDCSRPDSSVLHYLPEFAQIPFSFWLQSFPASRSFPMSQLFTSGGQSSGGSALVPPVNIQS